MQVRWVILTIVLILLYALFAQSAENHLQWDWTQGAPPTNGFPDEFIVLRGTSSGSETQELGRVTYSGPGTYDYFDQALNGATLYFYLVRSSSQAGVSTSSEVSSAGTGKTFFVATGGSNSNSCQQAKGTVASPSGNPKQTILNALTCIGGGDTLYVRTGTYTTQLQGSLNFQSRGPSWNTPVTISAYPSETVTIQSTGNVIDFPLNSGAYFLILQDLIINSNAGSSVSFNGIPASVLLGGSRVRFLRGEIKNWLADGAMDGLRIEGSLNEILGTAIHADNTGARTYGVNIRSDNNLVDRATVYGNSCYGVVLYRNGGDTAVHDNIIANSIIRNNGISPSSCAAGISINSGNANGVYNNVIYDTGNSGAGIRLDQSAQNTRVFNNTVYNNAGTGVVLTNAGILPTINNAIRNNIVYNNAATLSDGGLRGDGILRYFVVRAYDTQGIESANSNELSAVETNGRVSLQWNAVTTNNDGSPQTTLAGYIVYYGTSSGVYTANSGPLGNVLSTMLGGFTVSGSVVDHNVTSDPTFVNAGTRDLHIQTGSNAKDTGVNFSLYFTMDKDGIVRPFGSAWDIGAYEFHTPGSYVGSTPVGTGFFHR